MLLYRLIIVGEIMINVMGIIESSVVNGPGNRFVIWFQGCSFHCPGCINEDSWDFEERSMMEVSEIVERVKGSSTEGVTISGGEPFQQYEELSVLLENLFQLNLPLGIILFSGYTRAVIEEFDYLHCLDKISLLIDGRFEQALAVSESLRGSSNQSFSYSGDADSVKSIRSEINSQLPHQIEVVIYNGKVQLSGFLSLDKELLNEIGLKKY
jgi:anaerobic ribonucleoside-triphosphate reductase activating protein